MITDKVGYDDPEKTWLKVEVAADHSEEQRQSLLVIPAPYPEGKPQHRVIEVCVGAEHGVLRTDAGIAFTWGDNRYGQLGREIVEKEENSFPYPVLDLLESEVVQVAAGNNHCLALTSAGTVKAWGRNKSGQLGIGTTRDKVEPAWVMLEGTGGDQKQEERLGIGGRSPGDKRIITISAGGNSSIAAAANSDTWQWGEISINFKVDEGKDKKHKHKEAQAAVVSDRPYLIACWTRKNFRTQMRKDKDRVSIRESLCSVLDKDMQSQSTYGRLKDLTSEYYHWMDLIRDERSKSENERKDHSAKDSDKTAHEQEGGDQTDLQDTIAAYEREIEAIDREIDLYSKNIQSCEQQQQHNRKQIETLTHQQTKLTESKGKKSEEMLDPHTSGTKRKTLEAQLIEIGDFIEANQNTRATLLDQRSEVDKEKQRLQMELKTKKLKREELEKYRIEIEQWSRSAKKNSKATDADVNFLYREKDQLNKYFDSAKPISTGMDILAAKEKLEKDEQYLRKVLDRMKAQMKEKTDNHRSTSCKSLLDDLITLRRQLNDVIADSKYKDDFDFEHFFMGKDSDPEAKRG